MKDLDIGIIGLGVMGQNLALNIADKGFSVGGWDAWPDPVDRLAAKAATDRVHAFKSLPELLAVPGILSAARYKAVKGGPKYLAFYELENVGVLRTPAFTSRPRTPWGQRVSPSVIGSNLTRIVGEQILPDGIEMPERAMAPVLQIGRMSVPSEIDAEWNAWYNGEYIPGYRKVPGVIYARRYRVHEGVSKYTTVYEFASTAVPESADWKHQNQHSSPRSPRMRQAMTHAPGSPGIYTRIDP